VAVGTIIIVVGGFTLRLAVFGDQKNGRMMAAEMISDGFLKKGQNPF
jgi:hypothetical protein